MNRRQASPAAKVDQASRIKSNDTKMPLFERSQTKRMGKKARLARHNTRPPDAIHTLQRPGEALRKSAVAVKPNKTTATR
jgi:hypothetical protein